ncbi:MAG TPA: hypothetical protein VHS54_12030 [Jatrophihabitans sp.]|jgi:hypothetical protein|nr:hypothetical protein [Jatrophihabitans sp.]
MDDNQPDFRSQLHDAVYGLLIDKVRRDQYPSATMMNMVEAGMDEGQMAAYAQVLIDKVAADQFPSLDMIKRLTNLL